MTGKTPRTTLPPGIAKVMKRLRYPLDVILLCVRWYVAYALSDPKGDLRLYVALDELAELVEYAISGCNGTPHRGLNNATPLEAMEYFVRGRETMLVWLAEHQRRTLCLMQSARQCRVRA
ncbi:UNVERIFIED_ORG: hypothetical protein ABIC54_000712 [Burkholderia sp. 1263]|uniref:Transposase n=1 Tax=Paraburkholderia terricola TaxID=169427 RepID=A0ABU1M2H3_9BURK|nr:hypothetical protein [Paraburkholderia terricola]MDR6450340.1 hypothetical protein [Paraburkholderia terricola]MDR6485240.1 hypothetical protein [Paraburkholderia terricola]